MRGAYVTIRDDLPPVTNAQPVSSSEFNAQPDVPSVLAPFQQSRQELSLRFLLGELCLFVRRFQSITLRAHYSRYPESAERIAAELLEEHRPDVVYLAAAPGDVQQKRLTVLPRAIRYVPEQYPLYYVELTGTFDEYMNRFSGKSRRHQKQAVNKLRDFCGGDMRIQEYRQPTEMAQFHALGRAISALTYQERLLRVGLPDTPEFLEKLIREAAADNVRCFVLFHGERPMAYAYCSGVGRNLTYQVIGYDPEYRNLSPGRVLLYLMLEGFFAENRHDLFDFGAGEAFYKSLFATDSVRCADVYYFRRTIGNWIAVLAHIGLGKLSRSLVQLTEAAGVKKTLKSWFRRRASS